MNADADEDDGGGIPEWVVTFGDMMSLLLTFFIMLVSMSEIKDQERYQALVASIRRRFGHDASIDFFVPGEFQPRNSDMMYVASQGRADRLNILQGGDKVKAPVGNERLVRDVRRGKNSTVGTVVFFEEHSTQLSEQDKQLLEGVIEQVAGKPQWIEVRGHSTRRPVPVDSPWRDAYDLAYERVRVVAEYLIGNGVEEQRLRLGVAGSNEPVYTGTDENRMKQNARVQIMMWDEKRPTPSAILDNP